MARESKDWSCGSQPALTVARSVVKDVQRRTEIEADLREKDAGKIACCKLLLEIVRLDLFFSYCSVLT